jgi:pyruvate dehydrogenase E2 component (dihydrolipoamide acetyltransferase)
MAIEIKVPRLGWSMEEGTFIEWLKRDGQSVQAGEPLFAIEGDKAIQEVEAIGSGILRIPPNGPENGETVKVGVTLAFLTDPDEAAPFGVRGAADEAQAERPAGTGSQPAIPKAMSPRLAPTANAAARKGPRISPRAARAAGELGIDWQAIQGTGSTGRIRERDIRRAAAERPATASRPKASQPVHITATAANQPSFRRTIAARMLEGSQTTAPVTLTTTADATNLVSLRAQFKATVTGPDEVIPGYLDMITKLVGRALVENSELNRQWIDGQIVAPDGIDIAIAVDTPSGLLAPVLRNVPSLGLREIAVLAKDLTLRAHAAQLKATELNGGSFTISNLGAFGIDAFTPIINVPQCAILGLGRIARRATVVGDQIVARETITLSMTFDHRIVDGAPAARFLAVVRTAIENPGPWLVF